MRIIFVFVCNHCYCFWFIKVFYVKGINSGEGDEDKVKWFCYGFPAVKTMVFLQWKLIIVCIWLSIFRFQPGWQNCIKLKNNKDWLSWHFIGLFREFNAKYGEVMCCHGFHVQIILFPVEHPWYRNRRSVLSDRSNIISTSRFVSRVSSVLNCIEW